jgi:1-deoxy-D-xylulose-5-phosphate reductoisomerase
VCYLSAFSNVDLLIKQAKNFHPDAVCIAKKSEFKKLKAALQNTGIEVLSGSKGIEELALRNDIDLLLNALVGYSGMLPTLKALESGVDVALANKESLVVGGSIIQKELSKNNAKLFPVDSEHSAIWQCLIGENKNEINKLILTGSGGPFRKLPLSQFNSITKEQALNHPNWDMGSKITIDSATMMNKGFEIIEAYWLFNLPIDRLQVIIHPQSIIHSMVEFIDGSIKAQLGTPNMTIPINFALNYPKRTFNNNYRFNFLESNKLTFEEPDFKKFKCIKLAFDALKLGGSYSIVLNVVNDICVNAFLNNKINFIDIPNFIDEAMQDHSSNNLTDLESIFNTIDETKKYIKERFKL